VPAAAHRCPIDREKTQHLGGLTWDSHPFPHPSRFCASSRDGCTRQVAMPKLLHRRHDRRRERRGRLRSIVRWRRPRAPDTQSNRSALLHQFVRTQLERFLAETAAATDGTGVPRADCQGVRPVKAPRGAAAHWRAQSLHSTGRPVQSVDGTRDPSVSSGGPCLGRQTCAPGNARHLGVCPPPAHGHVLRLGICLAPAKMAARGQSASSIHAPVQGAR
jgi:hypothetical protein